MPSFWNGGLQSYLKALKAEHESRARALTDRMQTTSDLEKIKLIQREIEQVRLVYQQKIKEADQSLF